MTWVWPRCSAQAARYIQSAAVYGWGVAVRALCGPDPPSLSECPEFRMLPRVQLHVLILLVFSVVAVVALQRMRMPSSLGYLLVGALVGPHAFGLVPDVEHNRVLAEFGIVFLLFTIGLNFSLPQILAMRNLVFGLGTAQVGFTTIVVGVGAWLLGHAPETGFVIGAVVAQSSTRSSASS